MRSDYGRATHPQRLDDPLESQDVSRYQAHDPEVIWDIDCRVSLARIGWALVVVAAIGAIALAVLENL
jgi:hypothetical protein